MSRLLLAIALLVVLLGSSLAGWMVLRTDPPGEAALPGSATVDSTATTPSDLREAGGGEQARRETAAAGAAEAASPQDRGTSGPSGFLLRVAVRQPDGSPVVGARVQVETGSHGDALTDSGGLAQIVVDAGAEQVALRVEAEGYAHTRLRAWLDDLVEVTLQPAVRVDGRVLDASTEGPVAGARVWFDDGHQGCEPRQVESQADGSFQLEEIPLGTRVTIAAAADGYADGRARFQLLPGGRTDGLDVPLERSAAVRLRVVDFANQQPLPGARLVGMPDQPAADERGEIDAGRLIGESSDSTWIRVEAPGYCRLDRQIGFLDWGPERLVVVPMVAVARYEGVVRSVSGAPVAGAEVRVVSRDRERRGWGREGSIPQLEGWPLDWVLGAEGDEAVETDDQGRFVSRGVPPTSRGWSLEVSAGGFAETTLDPGLTAGPGRSTWVEVELEELRTGTIRGRLTLNGEPVAGTARWQGPSQSGQVATDPGGRFLMERVEPGQVRLRGVPRVRGRGSFGTLLEEQGPLVELAPGGELEQVVDLLLPLATLSGRVRTQRGDGVAGVDVIASRPQERALFETTSLAGGDFQLELPDLAGPWTLLVRGRWRVEPVQAPAGARGLELILTELGRLRVRILDAADGRPLREFEVAGSVPGQDGSRSLATTWRDPPDPGGWVEVEAPSGAVDLYVAPLDRTYAPVRASLVVPPSGAPPARVELDTSRGHELLLVLAEDSNRPPRRSMLYLLDEGDAARLPAWRDEQEFFGQLSAIVGDARALRSRRFSFDAEGRTTLRGLRGGRYRLVDGSGGRFEPAEVEIPTDGGAPFEVTWERRP